MSETLKWKVEGVYDGAGSHGGDIQRGDSYVVFYVPEAEPHDGLHALIEEAWYAVVFPDFPEDEANDPDVRYAVQCQTQFLICTDPDDPGGTEVWSDYIYEDATFLYETVEEADAEARKLAHVEAPEYLRWDGRTDTNGRVITGPLISTN